ncbi:UPF0585 protein CG18661 [Eumeta japonica]|uniref:UPF0585 protein CG18661 n=1 Tax=Eumeta variegata TaxID=151549 RepID=A0A4C1S8M3_EUMVA|nr:UPF0585 protein CG18661 [Eumeta japonica]
MGDWPIWHKCFSKEKLVYPAANRNKEAILQVLKRFIIPDVDENHTVFLEISSGSGLFENAGAYLKSEGLMITYGPYSKDGVISPESNVSFHASLKARDPSWGIRDINDLEKLAQKNNITLIDTIEMPANNKTLIWKKK